MAPFGDGGDDKGGRDARRGWDLLRSGSAPPTMVGSAAADGMLGGGSFFSGMDGIGARHRAVVPQVNGCSWS
jgi:pumilio RNA-binding family